MGAMILTCEQNRLERDKLDELLKRTAMPVFGGIFPAVFAGIEKLDTGTVVIGSPIPIFVQVFHDLGRSVNDFEAQIERFQSASRGLGTHLVIVDGFSFGIDTLLDALFTIHGLSGNYIGCGAGSLAAMKPSPCVITNQGLLQNSAAVALFDVESCVFAAHGFQSIHGPLRVTASAGHTVLRLNRRPAAEVYAEVIGEHSGATLTPMVFFDVAKAYPFGIARLGAEHVIRDHIDMTDDGGIVCVGEIKEGSMLNIMFGNAEMLIQSASFAASKCIDHTAVTSPVTFFIDCISRVLLLKERFREETAAVAAARPSFGIAAVGEIAGNRNDHLNFYNKTCVVAAVELP